MAVPPPSARPPSPPSSPGAAGLKLKPAAGQASAALPAGLGIVCTFKECFAARAGMATVVTLPAPRVQSHESELSCVGERAGKKKKKEAAAFTGVILSGEVCFG